MKKNILKGTAFFALLICVLGFINYIVCTKPSSFYQEKRNTVDVVMYGTSMMYCSINPAVLWKEYGISSFNFARQRQFIPLSYHYMKETLKYQKPKVIILEVLALGFEYEYPDQLAQGISASNLDPLKLSLNKIEAINISIPEGEKLSYVMPFIRQHMNYKNLKKDDFKNPQNFYKGYSFLLGTSDERQGLFVQMEDTDKCAEIFPKNLNYLYKIIELCQANQVHLVLYKSPTSSTSHYSKGISNTIRDIADKEGIPFIESNLLYDELGIEFSNDTIDGTHLNAFGSEKVTRYVGDFLVNQYQLPDHRQEEGYESWQKGAERYEREIQEYELKNEGNLISYLQKLQTPGYIVIIAAKDEASNNLNAAMQEQLQSLGLRETLQGKFRWSYIGVLDDGNCIYEHSENAPLEWNGAIDGLEINVSSKGYDAGNSASIVIDGKELCKNRRGLNIVVYDKRLSRVADSVCFDTYEDSAAVR